MRLNLDVGRFTGADLACNNVPYTCVCIQLTDATGQVITFTAPGYINDATNQTQMFGPTIKVRAGNTMRIQLTNNLVQLEPDAKPGGFGYHNPMVR
jgi:FtsP/CotA-like multicopper oxidase with cupredoxin domain